MKYNPAQKKFAPGTSRGPRRASTLLAQVADLERGERIKELREQRHLTQPVVADRVGVTLRAYQEWEAGGGILWENAKRLAKVLASNPDLIMSGEPLETPDLSVSRLGGVEAQVSALAALVSGLDEQLRLLRAETATRDAEVLKRIAELQPPSQESQSEQRP